MTREEACELLGVAPACARYSKYNAEELLFAVRRHRQKLASEIETAETPELAEEPRGTLSRIEEAYALLGNPETGKIAQPSEEEPQGLQISLQSYRRYQEDKAKEEAAKHAPAPENPQRGGSMRILLGSGGGLVGLLLIGGLLFLHFAKPAGTARVAAGPHAGQSWTNSLGEKFVAIPGLGVLFGVWDVRVEDYQAFLAANPGYDAGTDWKNPFSDSTQTPDDPVVDVNWADAHAFCAWLTRKERLEGKLAADQSYRLPTDAEWSTAAGLGDEGGGTPGVKDGQIQGVYPWEGDWPPPAGAGNYYGEENQGRDIDGTMLANYNDGYINTSPVGSFKANRYGLYDMGGNVWQWCEDWYNSDQKNRVMRGGAWDETNPKLLSSSYRYNDIPGRRLGYIGFRCVVTLSAP